MRQLFRHFKAKFQKYNIYRKAYSNCIIWPIEVFFRRGLFNQVAITAAKFSATGWILDIGTGPGYLPIKIAEQSPNVSIVGIDSIEHLVKDAAERAKEKKLENRVSFITATVELLPFADDTFNTILSTMSFHQWPDRQRGICEIFRVLKPKGRVLILVGRRRILNGIARITDYFTGRSISEIKSYFKAAGFQAVEVKKELDDTLHIIGVK